MRPFGDAEAAVVVDRDGQRSCVDRGVALQQLVGQAEDRFAAMTAGPRAVELRRQRGVVHPSWQASLDPPATELRRQQGVVLLSAILLRRGGPSHVSRPEGPYAAEARKLRSSFLVAVDNDGVVEDVEANGLASSPAAQTHLPHC